MPVDVAAARENYERYVYARDNGHLDFLKKADKCEDFFAGLQWEEALRRRLEAQGKPVLTINEIFATLMTVFGEQLANRADITFRPSRDGSDETATALAKVYMQIANSNMLDWLESEVFADGVLTSRGFYDARIRFDDHMQGEVGVSLLNPRNVVIDPDAEEYDPDYWKEVFITKWMSPNDIEMLYSKEDAEYLKHRTRSDFEYGYDSIDYPRDGFGGPKRFGDREHTDNALRRMVRVIERQHKQLRRVTHFVDKITGDMRAVPDSWSRQRVEQVAAQYNLGLTKKLIEQIRWTVSADNVLLHDEFSPYRHFTVVPYFPIFRRGRTIGLAENLLSPQEQLNKTSSQELHIVNTTANSGWKVKSGALANMDIEDLESRGAETGLVIEIATDMNDVEKIQPNQVPSGLDRISFKAKESIKSLANVSDSMRGFDRADVAAKAIQAKQVRGSVSLAKPQDNLARTRHLLARNTLDLIQGFYTEERVLQISGRGLTDTSEQLVINQVTPEGAVVNDLTVGEYQVVVTTVPARETFEQSQFQEALELRQLGIAIPDDVLIEHSHLSRKTEIAKRIRELNGGTEPTEAQMQMAELELQLKQLEAQSKQAETQLKVANAKLAEARAANTIKEMQAPPEQQDNGAGELMIKLKELELKKYQIDQELELKREELGMKRDQMRQEQVLKRVSAMDQMEQRRQQHEQKLEAARSQSSGEGGGRLASGG